jgi:hypothetical protein
MSRITVLKSEVSTPEGKKYKICELGYKTDEGKVKGMRIFGFGNMKPIFDVASAAQKGDVLEASFQQNDKGYWEFGSLSATGATAPTSANDVSAGSVGDSKPKGNWETAEERAAKQTLITRQACLNSAVAYFEVVKGKPSLEELIATAKHFETKYVRATDKQADSTVPTVQ